MNTAATRLRDPREGDSLDFAVLDVRLRATADPEDLAYIRAFTDAYEPDERSNAARPHVEVSAVRAERPGGLVEADGRDVWVHRSKHPYWNVRGRRIAPACVRWLNRPVVSVRDGERSGRVITAPDAAAAMTGEAAWHVCRSLALYARDARAGKLLHASAVALGGRCLLFVGRVSAGKTTLMTEAVLRHGAVPVANDRVLLAADGSRVVSWPSYASFTEGTLLDYDPLARAAHDYEEGRFPYRTQTWGPTLTRRYGKDAKRVYPMTWFAEATGTHYLRSAPLGAIVVTRLEPGLARDVLERTDLGDPGEREALAALLDAECFDGDEPSFCPWHELPLPSGGVTGGHAVEALRARGVPVYRFAASTSRFRSRLEQLLAEVGAR